MHNLFISLSLSLSGSLSLPPSFPPSLSLFPAARAHVLPKRAPVTRFTEGQPGVRPVPRCTRARADLARFVNKVQ